MDKDNRNHLNQQPAEDKRVTKWRTLGVLSACIAITLLLSTIVYLLLTSRQLTPQIPTTAPISPQVTTPESITSTPAVDLPPLYPRIQWEATESGRTVFRTSSNQLIEQDSNITDSVILETYPKDFLTYYQEGLTRRDWNQNEYASGPNGEVYGYKKNNYYIRFGVRAVVGGRLNKYQAFVEYSI